MELVGFSVTNYRSITKAHRLPIKRSTILIGPNNEGKSNILRAMVTALEVLRRIGGMRMQAGRIRGHHRDAIYDWGSDFPISLQGKTPDGKSAFDIEFQLTDTEISEFSAEVGSKLNGTLPISLGLGREITTFKVNKRVSGIWCGFQGLWLL